MDAEYYKSLNDAQYCPDQRASFVMPDMLGLAWDLGAVTTGPVTVPLVIALGMGVAGAGANASPLTGFGVVTLASLIPVNLVILLSLALPAPREAAAAVALAAAPPLHSEPATNITAPGSSVSRNRRGCFRSPSGLAPTPMTCLRSALTRCSPLRPHACPRYRKLAIGGMKRLLPRPWRVFVRWSRWWHS